MCAPSLGWEDPLEQEMATHSSILAWRISWAEEHTQNIYIKSIISICKHYEQLLICLTSFFFFSLKSLSSGVYLTQSASHFRLAVFHMCMAACHHNDSTALDLGLHQILVTHFFDNAWHMDSKCLGKEEKEAKKSNRTSL